MPHVAEVEDPYATSSAISPDGRTLVARVYLDVANPNDMPVEDTERMLAAAEEAEGQGLEIALDWTGRPAGRRAGAGSTEMLGLIAAAVILLITFGSLVAAGLPLAVAIGGLLVSSSLVGLAAAVVDVPDFAPIIGAMLGIAVGIDYALLMVTRFREWRAVGPRPRDRDRGDPRHGWPSRPRRRQHCGREHGGPVRDGPVDHERHRRRHDGGGPGRDARRPDPVPRAAGLPGHGGSTGFDCRSAVDRPRVSADGHLVPARRLGALEPPGAAAQRARRRRGVALLVVLALPFLGVQFAIPDAGNDPEDTSSTAGLRHAGRWLRAGHQRSAAGGRGLSADAGDDTALERLHAGLEGQPVWPRCRRRGSTLPATPR